MLGDSGADIEPDPAFSEKMALMPAGPSVRLVTNPKGRQTFLLELNLRLMILYLRTC